MSEPVSIVELTQPHPGEQLSPSESAISTIMRPVNDFFDWFGNLGIFFWRVLKAAVTPPYEGRELIRQLDEVGSRSFPLVVLAGAAVGIVLSL